MESGVFLLFAFFDRGNMAHWGGPVQRYTLEPRLFSFWHPSNLFPHAHTLWLSGLVEAGPICVSVHLGLAASRVGCIPIIFVLVFLSLHLLRPAAFSFCIYHTCLLVVLQG